jgi:hypothetical protein
MGVYADVAVSRGLDPGYSRSGDGAPAVGPDPVRQATSLGFSIGADFDFRRRGRLAIGYQRHSYGLGGDNQASTGAADVRLDLNWANLTSKLKARIGAGAGLGRGGGDLASVTGTTVHSEGHLGALAYAGLGVAWYVKPTMGLHALVGGQYFRQAVPQGVASSFGVMARLTCVLSFGDTRVDTQQAISTVEVSQGLPALATGARALGCEVRDVVHENLASLLVICPDDEREAVYIQTPDAVLLTCEHRDRDECKAWHAHIAEAARKVPGPK